MKDFIKTLVKDSPDPWAARNRAREYLQARILEALQRSGAMIPLAFHGGTALRFLHRIPRYSEDLGFTLERRGRGFDFRSALTAVRSAFLAEGYQVEIKLSEKQTVQKAFVKFGGLPFEACLSPHRSEVLAVKLEIDTNPPAGAGIETTLIRHFVPLNIQHHDKPSLLSGKLHALLMRAHTKGRDLYDLMWYLSDRTWPAPNLELLNNALAQTGWKGPRLGIDTWKREVSGRLAEVDFPRVVADVRPFLEPGADRSLLSEKNLLGLLKSAP